MKDREAIKELIEINATLVCWLSELGHHNQMKLITKLEKLLKELCKDENE